MIPIPAELSQRPVHDGMAVPYTQRRVDDGTPDWTALDEGRRRECIEQRWCGLCGQPLSYWIFFLGGDKSVQMRTFGEPAMHEACARYAILACPWLVREKRVALYKTRQYRPEVQSRVDPKTKRHTRGRIELRALPPKSIEWRVLE